jgi:hypothetical protein
MKTFDEFINESEESYKKGDKVKYQQSGKVHAGDDEIPVKSGIIKSVQKKNKSSNRNMVLDVIYVLDDGTHIVDADIISIEESINESYKKGDKVNYQLDYKGGVGVDADISKSPNIKKGVIKSRKKSLGTYKYTLTNGLVVTDSEIVGLVTENKNPIGDDYYVVTKKWDGVYGFRKGEIVSSSGDTLLATHDEEGYTYEFVFVELADPNYETQEEVPPEEFEDAFRLLNPMDPKDAKYFKKLSKWGLAEYGTVYWVGTYYEKKEMTPIDTAQAVLDRAERTTSESPRQAVKKIENYLGKQTEILRNKIWVVQKWKDLFDIVFADGQQLETSARKLDKLLKKHKFIK